MNSRVTGVLTFLVVCTLLVTTTQVSAIDTFRENGSALVYSTSISAKTSQENITAALTDSYSFLQIGDQWNVTETLTGKIICSPSTARLSVRFRTPSDIMGTNSTVSNDPNIGIKVSYVVQDRVVQSTPIGPNVPIGFSAKCTSSGVDIGPISQATPALYASSFRYYVLFYIEPSGLGVGSSVPVAIMTSTISGTQTLVVLNTPRLALVGTLTGVISGIMYWDRESGILLLEESTSSTQSESMMLISSTAPIPEFHLPQITLILTISILLFAFVRNRKRIQKTWRKLSLIRLTCPID